MTRLEAKTKVTCAVGQFAAEMGPAWEEPKNWAEVSSNLVDVIVQVGEFMDEDHIAVLMTAAALAHRQSRIDASLRPKGKKRG